MAYIIALLCACLFKVVSCMVMIRNVAGYNAFVEKCRECFVLYYHPWCKVAQRMERELMLAEEMLEGGLNLLIAMNYSIGVVDMTLVSTKQMTFYPKSFPLLVYMTDGEIKKEYRGVYKQKSISCFIIHSLTKDIIRIRTKEELKAIIKAFDHVLLLITQGELNSTASISLDISSLVVHANTFNVYNTSKLTSNESISVTFIKGKKKNEHSLLNSSSIDTEIFYFIQTKPKPKQLYRSVSEDLINELIQKRRAGLILFKNKYDNQTALIEQQIKANVSLLYPKLLLVITDLTGKKSFKLSRLLKVDHSSLPQLRYVSHKNNQLLKYSFNDKALSYDNMIGFIANCHNGTYAPYYNSEDVSLNDDSSASVKVITRLNFNYYLYHYSKGAQTMVLYICPKWCLHCKKVSSSKTYETISLLFASLNVLFGKINPDPDMNEVSQFSNIPFKSFPTLLIYLPSRKSDPIAYEDKYTKEDVIAFIRYHTQYKHTDL